MQVINLMRQVKIKEFETKLQDWDFLAQLPISINGFNFVKGTGITGRVVNIAAYVNESIHSCVDLIYMAETADYVPVKTIGLHNFCDERFFCRDREKFVKMMFQYLPDIIGDADRSRNHPLCYEMSNIDFAGWKYWTKLPKRIEGYELFLTPDNPVRYINGSILFLDYTDFNRCNQVVFMYNTFREELFAELKKKYIPLTTERLDAKKLSDLEKLMDTQLEATLHELSR